jgi:hypothetical protein
MQNMQVKINNYIMMNQLSKCTTVKKIFKRFTRKKVQRANINLLMK